jgi:hypothetical protein
VSRVEGKIISEPEAPSHIQKVHPPHQIIGNLNERVTRSLRLAHLSCFSNTLFVAIFGGSSHTLVSRFQKMMESEFQMSMMGELTFFLGIQVKQTKQGKFVHQVKYTKDLMKKFNMTELKSVSTPMSFTASLGPNEDGDAVDQREYRSMIGSLLYLTTTRSDIQFAMGLCARFEASPRSSYRTVVQ